MPQCSNSAGPYDREKSNEINEGKYKTSNMVDRRARQSIEGVTNTYVDEATHDSDIR